MTMVNVMTVIIEVLAAPPDLSYKPLSPISLPPHRDLSQPQPPSRDAELGF